MIVPYCFVDLIATVSQNGKCTLKILLPVSAGKAVD